MWRGRDRGQRSGAQWYVRAGQAPRPLCWACSCRFSTPTSHPHFLLAWTTGSLRPLESMYRREGTGGLPVAPGLPGLTMAMLYGQQGLVVKAVALEPEQ